MAYNKTLWIDDETIIDAEKMNKIEQQLNTLTETQTNLASAKADKNSVYTKSETDSRIQNVINSAPAALDTLKELADALGNDANFSATVASQIATKADKVHSHITVGESQPTTDFWFKVVG